MVITLAIVAMSSLAPAQVQMDDAQSQTLQVFGVGRMTVVPDSAVITLGAVASAPEAAAAQQQVNQIAEKTITACIDLGTPPNKITTSEFHLNPIYQRDERGMTNQQNITGYEAVYMISVTVEKIDDVGKIIDTAFKNGVNRFNHVRFTLTDDSKARHDALKVAVADARSKAPAIAEAAGVRLLNIRRITEDRSSFYPMARMAGASFIASAQPFAATPIQPGELTISASVVIEYAIAPQP